MKTIDEIISALEKYKAHINELELENITLRQENEKLKKELNQSKASTEEVENNTLSEIEEFSFQQIANIIDDETSPEILMKCLNVLLDADKKDGRHASPIITDMILNSCLPQEGFEKIFEDIKISVGKKRISDKYGKRLHNLLKSQKLSRETEAEAVEYFVRKTFQRERINDFSIKRLRYFSKSYSKYAREKINEIIDSIEL